MSVFKAQAGWCALPIDAAQSLPGQPLVDLAGEGMGILLVEHDVQLVMRVCAQIYVLDFGAILAEGSPHEIQQDQAVLDAYLGTPAEVPVG